MAITTDEFIAKANIIHNNKYDYSKAVYVNSKAKVDIICPVHGVFSQSPDKHINGKCGCPMCSGNTKHTTESFVSSAIRVHGDLYDYSKVEYVNNKTDVEILCFKHGVFKQSPTNHLAGKGCPYCANNQRLTTQEFIQRATAVHGNKYCYDAVDYKGNRQPITIICPIHGEFVQRPYAHLMGEGCASCGKLSQLEHRDSKAIYSKCINTCLNKYGVENPMFNEDVRNRQLIAVRSKQVNDKRIATKRDRDSFNTSSLELKLKHLLIQIFGEQDVCTNYVSNVYPFKCDYYIKSRNLYIELNAHWTHGGHWYTESDRLRIDEWNTKSKFYQNAVTTFSVRDVKKRNIARQNVLNYVVFWKNDLSDAYEWINHGCPDGHDWLIEYSWL